MKSIFLVTGFVFFLGLASCTSLKPETPQQNQAFWVMDSADILTTTQEDSIAGLAKALADDIGSQIAVLTINTLAGERIEDYSLRTANALRLGRVTHDDGILITVAYHDRSVRIEVGEGLEKIIKDEVAARVIAEDMVPDFQQDNFAMGLYRAVTTISDLIRDNKDLVGEKWKSTENK